MADKIDSLPTTRKFSVKADSPQGQRLKRLFTALQTAEKRASGLVVKQKDNNEHAALCMVDEIRQVFVDEGVDVSELDSILKNSNRRLSPMEMVSAAMLNPSIMSSLMVPGTDPATIKSLIGHAAGSMGAPKRNPASCVHRGDKLRMADCSG